MELPTISVDRAIPHYVQDLDMYETTIAQYYAQLPEAAKPPLSKCHIHFSAMAWIMDGGAIRGAHLRNPDDSAQFDPQAPPANIVIGLGSFLVTESLNELSTALQHELQHYALKTTMEPTPLSPEDEYTMRMYRVAHSLTYRGVGFLTKAAVATTIVDLFAGAEVSYWEATPVGLGLTAAASLLDPRPRRQRRELAAEVRKIKEQRPHEAAAYESIDPEYVLAAATPAEPKPKKILIRGINGPEKRLNSFTDAVHLQQSLKPAPAR